MRLTCVFVAAAVLGGCASVKVVRVDPARVDAPYADANKQQTTGVLFYRPRPYLMVTQGPPAADPKPSGGSARTAKPGATEPTLSVQIVWLPDYSQEYEIQAHPGVGSVTFNPTLKDGWNLAGLSATVDSKTAELITAASGMAGAFAPRTAGSKPICTGLYPIMVDRTTGLISGLGSPAVVFEDRNQCVPLQ
ncbi:MAG TPA: hypothetical protein VGD60_05600 [Candidatus Acidoferrales bacterium]